MNEDKVRSSNLDPKLKNNQLCIDKQVKKSLNLLKKPKPIIVFVDHKSC